MLQNVDEGITVKGNELNEQYNYSMIGELEQSSVIVIQLKGMQRSSGVVVQEPITVSTKLECSSCGTKSKSSFKFCPNCGTFLV
jgi:lipopolysaccharide biosynthesis regulator YciM